MSQYFINNSIVEKTDAALHSILEDAYNQKIRPNCLCKTPGLPMYICRTHENQFLIKRMPNSGHLHHPDCESYEIPSELSGRGEVENKAISEDHESGLTSLKLDFSLSKQSSNKAPPSGEGSSTTDVKAEPTKLTIRSLLHFLYEDAGLNKWHPKMEGKRSWYVIRKYLTQAAQNAVVRKNVLAENILIPESFLLDHKDEIVARRRQLLSKFKKQGKKQPMGILIGELKDIEEARFGYKMIIKHMPDTPVYMDEKVHKRIQKTFATELAFFQENEKIHLLVISTFLLSASGHPQVDTISFMLVDTNWLPFENLEELELIEHLCSNNRHFIKGLRYNLGAPDVIASVLLIDTQEQPTAVYLVPPEPSDSYHDELNVVIDNSDLKSTIIDFSAGDTLSKI